MQLSSCIKGEQAIRPECPLPATQDTTEPFSTLQSFLFQAGDSGFIHIFLYGNYFTLIACVCCLLPKSCYSPRGKTEGESICFIDFSDQDFWGLRERESSCERCNTSLVVNGNNSPKTLQPLIDGPLGNSSSAMERSSLYG